MGRWHVVEDVALADCALELGGHDLADVFETGAAALAELMVDPATVAVTVCRTIGLEAAAIDLLLYDWLSELIFLKDRDRQVFTRCHVRVLGDGPWHLTARLEGVLPTWGRSGGRRREVEKWGGLASGMWGAAPPGKAGRGLNSNVHSVSPVAFGMQQVDRARERRPKTGREREEQP